MPSNQLDHDYYTTRTAIHDTPPTNTLTPPDISRTEPPSTVMRPLVLLLSLAAGVSGGPKKPRDTPPPDQVHRKFPLDLRPVRAARSSYQPTPVSAAAAAARLPRLRSRRLPLLLTYTTATTLLLQYTN